MPCGGRVGWRSYSRPTPTPITHVSIYLKCSNCGKSMRAPDSAAGKRGQCPRCRLPIGVPDIGEEVSEEPKEIDGQSSEEMDEAEWPQPPPPPVMPPPPPPTLSPEVNLLSLTAPGVPSPFASQYPARPLTAATAVWDADRFTSDTRYADRESPVPRRLLDDRDRHGMPWEIVNHPSPFVATVTSVLRNPVEAFSCMRRTGGQGHLAFALTGLVAGGA